MAQEQRTVPLVFSDGTGSEAVATGNNAAWHCRCDRVLPLLGRSGLVSGVTSGSSVKCPDCDRCYYVVPDGKDWGRVLRVEEVQ